MSIKKVLTIAGSDTSGSENVSGKRSVWNERSDSYCYNGS